MSYSYLVHRTDRTLDFAAARSRIDRLTQQDLEGAFDGDVQLRGEPYLLGLRYDLASVQQDLRDALDLVSGEKDDDDSGPAVSRLPVQEYTVILAHGHQDWVVTEVVERLDLLDAFPQVCEALGLEKKVQ